MAKGARQKKDRQGNHASSKGATLLKNYKGFVIPHSKGFVVDRIDASTITPEEFFEQYIKPRKPCVLLNLQPDTLQQWTNSMLRDKAGHQSIMVEQRQTEKSNFGRDAPRVPMLFKDFLDKIDAGSNMYYLTSQTTNYESNELPDVVAPPLTALLDDITLRPSIVGNLVPFQVNLWMGNVKGGLPSSSGLHHDFHDNIYMLLRGVKIFNIYTPNEAHLLEMTGKLTGIHENGMLLYKSHPFISENGIPPIIYHEHLVQLQSNLEDIRVAITKRISEFSTPHESSTPSPSSAGSEMGDDVIIDDNVFLHGVEYWAKDGKDTPAWTLNYLHAAVARVEQLIDYAIEEDLELEMKFHFNDGDSDGDLSDFDDVASKRGKKKQRYNDDHDTTKGSPATDGNDTNDEALFSHFSKIPPSSVYKTTPLLPPTAGQVKAALTSTNTPSLPSSFDSELYTKVFKHLQSLTQPPPESAKGDDSALTSITIDADPHLPTLRQANKATILLLPGESLFLPTGFFHEVRSLNLSRDDARNADHSQHDKQGHMAINYWFHPPSLRDSTATKAFSSIPLFTNPYQNLFWQSYWRKHCAHYDKTHEESS